MFPSFCKLQTSCSPPLTPLKVKGTTLPFTHNDNEDFWNVWFCIENIDTTQLKFPSRDNTIKIPITRDNKLTIYNAQRSWIGNTADRSISWAEWHLFFDCYNKWQH